MTPSPASAPVALLPVALPAGLPAPVSAERIEAVSRQLRAAAGPPGSGPAAELVGPGSELEKLSHDFFTYSPVLTPLLSGHHAQLVVKATQLGHVQQVAAACAQQQVPLTVRGAGTGNYGQCVPLAGGVVLDLSGLRQLRQFDAASGVLTAEAGCLLGDLDRQLAVRGRALRLTPSTSRSATLGGFIAGGSGGIGSLCWGFLRDPGNLLGLEIVTVEPEPRLLTLDATGSRPLNHAYGTNGILTAVTVPTAAAETWQQLVVDFADWDRALEAARLLPCAALVLQELCLLEAPIARQLPLPGGCPAARGHRLLLLAPAGLTGRPMPLPPLLDALGVRFLGLPGVRRSLCRTAFADPSASVGPAEEEIASLHLATPGWADSLRRFARSGGFAGCGEPLPSQPLEVLWGADDRILRAPQKKAALALLGDRVKELADCGHLPHLDQSNQVAAAWLTPGLC